MMNFKCRTIRYLLPVLLTGSLFISSCRKENSNESLYSIKLETVDHEKFSLDQLEGKTSVILFLQPECPFCNSYGKTLRSLDSTFKSQDVHVYGAVAGKNFPDDDIIAYREKFKLQFPFILDPDFRLTRELKATITPQAYLLDDKGVVLYHGMIDNWGYEIGKARARATEFYLLEAVSNHKAGKPLAMDSTKAIGCYIQ